MNKLKRLLNEVQQELDREMEKAYIVYPRKDLILALNYFERLASEYEETPELYAIYKSHAVALKELIYSPDIIAYYCKVELERQMKGIL